jgi:carbamoyltransferase
MKLLSLALQDHDANISYFDGNNVHYHKLERTKSIKHFGTPSMWEWKNEIKNLWNITENDVDEILFIMALGDREFDVFHSSPNCPLVEKFENVIDLKILTNPKKSWYMQHHYSHALSGWMMYDKEPDVCIVVDGLGDRKTWSVFRNDVKIDSGDLNMGSIGFMMMEAGKYLGVKSKFDIDYAGKVMGLQSYGNIDYNYLEKLKNFNINHVNQIFSPKTWIAHKQDALLAQLSPLDWIKTVHFKMEQVMIDFFKQYAKEDETIFYSGGVAQNVIWNTALKNVFKNLIIAPHSADEGLSLGGLEWMRKQHNLSKFKLENFPYVQSDECPDEVTDETIKHAAKLLSEGKIIGWYQGRGEVGPRALGNRSILMDPRISNGKERINFVKNRENYRPFGASALKEYANDMFDVKFDDEYMLYVTNVKSNDIKSITHVDGTCRLQTVTEKTNLNFYKLLKEFHRLTGCPVLLNTSLNLNGKPICGNIGEAKEIFIMTNINCIFIGNEFYTKG